jgi:hypothetical protein
VNEPKFEKLAIDNIEATAATQVRVRIDKAVVEQYTEDFKDGAAFPPLDVYCERNTERYVLADGFHRHRAAINAGRTEIGCNVHEGTMHDALVHALGSNAEHGHRRSNADKRHAVEMALKDPQLSKLKQKEIADVCRVTTRTVRRLQAELYDDDKPKKKKSKKKRTKSASKPKGKDFRDSGIEPTQGDVELAELREALKAIKVLPYDGETAATQKLPLTKGDIADCEYAATWLGDLVITYRNAERAAKDAKQ